MRLLVHKYMLCHLQLLLHGSDHLVELPNCSYWSENFVTLDSFTETVDSPPTVGQSCIQ